MTCNFDDIKKRADSGYAGCGGDTASFYAAMADVQAMLAEVEQLREQNHDLRLMAEEAARAENANAEDAKKERAAVVALLRESQRMYQMHRSPGAESLVRNLADIIERGDHRKETA